MKIKKEGVTEVPTAEKVYEHLPEAVEPAAVPVVEPASAPNGAQEAETMEPAMAPVAEPPKAIEQEGDEMKSLRGLNLQFLGGAVQRSREKLGGLLDQLLDAPQLKVLDEMIGHLEKRRKNPAARRDYKPGTWSASGN